MTAIATPEPLYTSEPRADAPLDAVQARSANPTFLARMAIGALAARLPLPWPLPSGTPPSPKRRFRSAYQAPKPNGPDPDNGLPDLAELDAAAWARLSPFDLALRLIDFSPLRPVLAAKLYQPSALGRVPFDPVSLFLLFGWQLVNRWNRLEVLRHLKEPRYADYALAFGFGGSGQGPYPSESGYRYFLTTLGKEPLHDLLVQSIELVRRAGLIPESVESAATLSFDGQLHDAASRLRCPSVGATCYQPTSEASPRPCPAREKGQVGCPCDSLACKSVCKRAALRDPAARFVWYRGHNQGDTTCSATPPSASAPTGTSPAGAVGSAGGEGRFGYRSLPAQLVDTIWRLSWTLDEAALAPANTHEESPAASLLRQVVGEYPWLHIASAVGDAGLGYAPFLEVAYELGVRRVIDLRADPRTDHDRDAWAIRGYDDKGWPICQFGSRLHPNGFDAGRHRMKWCCHHACETPPEVPTGQPICPPDCPYRDRDKHPLGRIMNVGKTFADGSLRLVRDVPYGSAAWKGLYRRGRNAAEGRNARLEEWGLKRLPVFGLPRAQATIFLADLWANLLQLARLVKEATLSQLAEAAPR
jgi:hypothetical protein